MLRSLVFLVLASALSAQEAPIRLPLLESKSYSARDLAVTANTLIALGREKAIETLKVRLSAPADRSRTFGDRGERVSWLCRLLFEAKEGATLRAPRFGALSLPYKSMPLTRWPKYPIAVEAGVPFVLSEGYLLAGLGEPPRKYLEFCAAHGVFRTKPYPVPTRETALTATKGLTGSERWKAIQWKHESEGLKYTIDAEHILSALKAQAEGIPAEKK